MAVTLAGPPIVNKRIYQPFKSVSLSLLIESNERNLDIEAMKYFLNGLVRKVGLAPASVPNENPFISVSDKGLSAGCLMDGSHVFLHISNENEDQNLQIDFFTNIELDMRNFIDFIQGSFIIKDWDWKAFTRRHLISEEGSYK